MNMKRDLVASVFLLVSKYRERKRREQVRYDVNEKYASIEIADKSILSVFDKGNRCSANSCR